MTTGGDVHQRLGRRKAERDRQVSVAETVIVRRISSESNGTPIRFITMPRSPRWLSDPMPANEAILLFESSSMAISIA
jgi:hypothetical protein